VHEIAFILRYERKKEMRNMIKRLRAELGVNSESGVTAIEYGLLAALIALVIIGGVTVLGTNLTALFTAISAKLVAP
jgi:pilus assembly protein Flp/PilA